MNKILFGILLIPCLLLPINSAAQEYDVVTITVNAPSYDASKPPVFARVKYNKLCPIVITSDDMGRGELVRNWAFFNGYPVFANNKYGQMVRGDKFLDVPYTSLLSMQEQDLKRETHQPLTFTDGAGGIRRFTGTSAIWPNQADNNNYTLMTGNDAKTMIRMGWSFAQHDVDVSSTTAEAIAARFQPLSEQWEAYTGIGLKVMVEPAGEHKYIDAGKLSDEICWNIFQNGSLPNYPEMTNIMISDWTTGSDWTSFGTGKPDATTRRIFFQGHEEEWTNAINNADGTQIIIGGTHGIGNDMLSFLQSLSQNGNSAKKDQFWVTSADEVWEYYHLYNNAEITDVSYNDGKLTFNVKIPRYQKSQFRELTINIPGITNGTDCTFSDNVVTADAQQNNGQYTINFGIEDKIYRYISELSSYFRSNLYNTYVKDDAQYLINLLKPGTKKDEYQAALDAEPNYSFTIRNNLGDIILSSISDEAVPLNYSIPKYALSGTDLYITQKNTQKPYYVNTFTPEGKNQTIVIDYTKYLENVVFYSEGEDLRNAGYAPSNQNLVNTNGSAEQYVYQNASGGAAGIITSSTITTLQPGKYKIVAGVGDSWNSIANGRTAVFTFKLDGKTVYTTQTKITGIEELAKDDIVVREESDLTLEATGCGNSRWLDYLYIQRTGDYDNTYPEANLEASSTQIDVTNGIGSIILNATTGIPQGSEATVTKTIIKDQEGNIVAQNNGTTCSYEFTPNSLGSFTFRAEGIDSNSKTGFSEEVTITVSNDYTLEVVSNLGDQLVSISYEAQTTNKNYRYVYPRFLLKGTNLYETEPRNTGAKQLHYAENVSFSIDNNRIERTITYSPMATNVIYYIEGENLTGATKRFSDAETLGFGSAAAYAVALGSMGACGSIATATITTLPAGRYKVVAGIGTTSDTNNTATYTFKLGEETLSTYTPNTRYAISTFTSEDFEVTESTSFTITSNKGTGNDQNWIDYLYIQKLDDTSVTVTSAGYATFSSPYTLDFTNVTDIKAYTANIDNDQVIMKKVTGIIPAATGLFLQGNVGTTVICNVPLATTVAAAVEDNALVAHLEAGKVAAGNYVLSAQNGTNVAFRRLTSDTEMNGGRAYLRYKGSTAPYLYISDTSTEIQLIFDDNTNDEQSCYDLQGRPVSSTTKGVIIKNGHKIINR